MSGVRYDVRYLNLNFSLQPRRETTRSWLCNSKSLVRFPLDVPGIVPLARQARLKVGSEGDEFGLNDIPDDFVVHAIIAVDQAVTKSDNFPPFGATEFQGRLHGHGLAQGFADDLELALDRGTYEFAGGEIGERLSLRESLDSPGGFQGVDQSLGDFSLHRESADRWRWRGGGSGYEPSGR